MSTTPTETRIGRGWRRLVLDHAVPLRPGEIITAHATFSEVHAIQNRLKRGIRRAEPKDAATIVRLARALAVYEHEPVERVRMTESDVLRDGFGENPRFEVLLAELGGRVVGFALFFENYSTWEGRPGIYVEDLFLEEPARGSGLGRELLAEIARIAQARGCVRIDLAVMDWNPTRGFYEQLGLEQQTDWLPYRLTATGIAKLAGSRPAPTIPKS